MPFSSSAFTRLASVKRGGGCVKCCDGMTSTSLSGLALGRARAVGPRFVLGLVVTALAVDDEEAVEEHHASGRAQHVVARS